MSHTGKPHLEVVAETPHIIERKKNTILIAVAAILIIVCGYLAYTNLYAEPKTKEAQTAMFRAEEYFRNGQDSLALFGDEKGALGFEAIMSEYGSTKPGKLAKLYAGIAYARMGQTDKALEYLKGYSSNDKIISHLVEGTIGDCLVNQGKEADAINHFIKAAKAVDNSAQSPLLYKKAGLIYRTQGNQEKVIEIFSLIKNNYGDSPLAMEADKYIKEAELLKK